MPVLLQTCRIPETSATLMLPSPTRAHWVMTLVQVVSDMEPGKCRNCHLHLLPLYLNPDSDGGGGGGASAPGSLPLPSGASGHISHPLDWGSCQGWRAAHCLPCIRRALFHMDILSDRLFFSLWLKIDASPRRSCNRAACMNWKIDK